MFFWGLLPTAGNDQFALSVKCWPPMVSLLTSDLFFKTLKAEISNRKLLYNELVTIASPLMESGTVVAGNVSKTMNELETSWDAIELTSLKRITDLKDVLYRWSEYTEAMKVLMKWLRDTERKINRPLHRLTVEDLEKTLAQYQVILVGF